MSEHVLTGLAIIAVLGITSQWIAWRMKLPSILILLTVGFLAGPVFGIIHPDELLGGVLFPFVSLSVGLIMFEGALGLRVSQIQTVGVVIRNLITIGAAVTWVLSAIAARFILGFEWSLAVLLGAILVVTGPTVIGPLLRHVKPNGPVGPILRWEGILIDPVGATLGLLVFEFIRASNFRVATAGAASGLILTIIVGTVIGLIAAFVLYQLLRRYWIPDYLTNPITLMFVVGAFALSHVFQHESGLLTVTVMGIALANQKKVPVRHIIEFKENVGTLLLAALFILLSARLRLETLSLLGGEIIVFIAVLMLVIRPISIAVSTFGSPLTLRERIFLAWMAPRGIVAAAVTSIFSLGLVESGYMQAERLVPVMFSVIVVTVAVYGLTALPLARRLGISPKRAPQGVLFVGAHDWARAMAKALQDLGYSVLMVDSNYANTHAARMEGLPTHYGNILAEGAVEELNLDGIGRILAMTSNDEVNALAALHFVEVFGRAEVYQLPYRRKEAMPDAEVAGHLRGRFLFKHNATFGYMKALYEAGAVVKTTKLTREFTYDKFKAMYGDAITPLFLIEDATGKLYIFNTDQPPTPGQGYSIVSMAIPRGEAAITRTQAAEPLMGD